MPSELRQSPTRASEIKQKHLRRVLYATSSFVHHFVAIAEFKLELQSRNVQFGSNWIFFVLLFYVILRFDGWHRKWIGHLFYTMSSFVHQWIQTGFTVQKYPNWGKISFGLCDLDLWHWLLAWAPLLPMVNYMTKTLWKRHHRQRQTDRRTDGQNRSLSCLVAAKNIQQNFKYWKKFLTIFLSKPTFVQLIDT